MDSDDLSRGWGDRSLESISRRVRCSRRATHRSLSQFDRYFDLIVNAWVVENFLWDMGLTTRHNRHHLLRRNATPS
jgi:hypothetical protein